MPKSRKFYGIQFKAHSRATGLKHTNKEEVFGEGHPRTFAPPGLFNRGFRDYPAVPRYRLSKRLGRMLCDIEQHGAYWMVSDRAKHALSELSDVDFKFMAVETETDPGQESVTLWICEIMTILDPVDEARSKVTIKESDAGTPVYQRSANLTLFFKEEKVGGHCAFRLTKSFNMIVCDDIFKQAIRDAGLTGLTFQDLTP